MAVADYFIKLDGIDGESKDSKHKNEIDILTFQFKATQAGTSNTGGGAGKGKVQAEDLVITKHVDKASPKIYQYCCSGQPIKTLVLTARKAGKDQQEHYKVTLTDVLVSSFQHGGGPGGPGSGPGDDWSPIENIAFNYSTIELGYKEQQADGTLAGEVKGTWDFKQNKLK
jgi:type VI secretion system secreted protein Hcp